MLRALPAISGVTGKVEFNSARHAQRYTASHCRADRAGQLERLHQSIKRDGGAAKQCNDKLASLVLIELISQGFLPIVTVVKNEIKGCRPVIDKIERKFLCITRQAGYIDLIPRRCRSVKRCDASDINRSRISITFHISVGAFARYLAHINFPLKTS